MQIGPDGAIYVARAGTTYLGRIASPNEKGTNCNYVDEAVDLKGRNSNYGLPTYYNSIIINTDITIENACLGDSSIIKLSGTVPDSISIDFGDSSSVVYDGLPLRLAHLYSDPGIYDLTFIHYYPSKTNSTIIKAYVFEVPEIDLGRDTILCEGESISFNLDGSAIYTWEDGSNSQKRTITSGGLYHIEANNQSCIKTDSIKVSFKVKPEIPFNDEYLLCENDSLVLSMGVNVDYMEWSTGDTSHQHTFKEDGKYWVKAGMHRCYDSMSFELKVFTIPQFDLGKDSNYCNIDSLNLSTGLSNLEHLWSSGSTQDNIWIYESGLYSVEVQNGPCKSSDLVNIGFFESEAIELEDHVVCAGDSILIGTTERPGTFLWNTGATTSSIYVLDEGTYTLEYSNSCDTYIDSAKIELRDCDCFVHLPTAFSPNGDGLNENFPPDFECRFFRYELVIYNRWGQKMFESTENANNWDGTFRGVSAPNGLYIYHLSYMDQTGLHHVQGQVLIVR
ncbi:gliding motility-associated C-terminal domain-containing protein [bacterium]|nr:gliding motility-associated C-terminal domain-containing protein [bacterium]